MTKLSRAKLGMEQHIDADRLRLLSERFRAGPASRYVIRPLLMALLVTSIALAILAVIEAVVGDKRWSSTAFLFFFIALEAIYTTNWLGQTRQMPIDKTAYRAAELLLLLVITRVATLAIFAEGALDLAQLRGYLQSPLSFFANPPFLVTLLLAFIVWRLAVVLSGLFTELEIKDSELRYRSLPAAHRIAHVDDQPIAVSRKYLVDRYMRFWLLGGVVMVIAAGLSTLEQQSEAVLLAPLVSARANLEPRILIVLMLYFIIGLWLLSQAKLMQANARWLANDIETDAHTRRTWQRASLLMLLLVFVVAAFLPIGSTTALSRIVDALILLIFFIANVVIFLLLLPFALLLSLIPGGESGPLERIQTPLQPLPIESAPAEPSAFADTISIIISSGFWALLIGAVVLSLLFFLRERRQRVSRGDVLQLWDRIVAWFKNTWLLLRGQMQTVQLSLSSLIETEVPPEETAAQTRSRWPFLRIGALSPRDQIRYFYLSVVKRAGARGVKRPAAGTPAEFAEDLKQNWPAAEEELDDLTGAFQKARYSDSPVSSEDIPPVRDTWKTVRRELRRGTGPGTNAAEEKDDES
jgi:Domain of unknown function (DUF4129)